MSKIGCLLGMVIGFAVAVVISYFLGCIVFEKNPSQMNELCVTYYHKLVDNGGAAAGKAADVAYKEIKK